MDAAPARLDPALAIDAVFVLSVKTFAGRIAHVKQELARFGIPFAFIFEFDADALDDATIARHFNGGTPMKKQMSLTLKHLHAWRLACARGCRRIMVFEDDVVLFPAFHARLAAAMRAADALAPGWHVFLGGADAKVPDRFFLDPRPLVPLASTTAEGYVSDLEACRRRLAWSEANKIRHPADQLITHIDRLAGIAQYWPPEPLVEQGSVTGLFDSALDATRLKHSHAYNVARHRWTKWRRRTLRRAWVRALAGLRRPSPTDRS
ncbi:MAG TPA: glycosyltransferase family 25 protein [Xanthobacteraceae bacterium]|nr:glycosyltransferase family 25 protein [Xanthobacteraceae bacterium]